MITSLSDARTSPFEDSSSVSSSSSTVTDLDLEALEVDGVGVGEGGVGDEGVGAVEAGVDVGSGFFAVELLDVRAPRAFFTPLINPSNDACSLRLLG